MPGCKRVKRCSRDQLRCLFLFSKTLLVNVQLTFQFGSQRVLSVSGVADAIHIAVYYIGTILQEHPLAPTTHASHTSYRPAGTNQSYNSGGGDYNNNRSGGGQQSQPRQQQNFGSNSSAAGGQTQQIFIPNELVGKSSVASVSFSRTTAEQKYDVAGSIIGKGGAKINEIRQLSQCQIKICEPGEGSPGANPLERVRHLNLFSLPLARLCSYLSCTARHDSRITFRHTDGNHDTLPTT